MNDDATTEYERGHVAGEINARLAQHDLHFAAINGSIADLAREMHGVGEQTTRMADGLAFEKQADVGRRTDNLETVRLAAQRTNNRILSMGLMVSAMVIIVNVVVVLVVHHVF